MVGQGFHGGSVLTWWVCAYMVGLRLHAESVLAWRVCAYIVGHGELLFYTF